MGRIKQRFIPGVHLTGIADKGRSIGRSAEGQVVFVEQAVPGDVVDVRIVQKKKGILIGVPEAYHQQSSDRTVPFCDHFGVCGGCKWQHLGYQAQLRHKERVVRDAAERIAKLTVPDFRSIIGGEKTAYYRNKLEFSFSNKRWLTTEEIAAGADNRVDVLGFHRQGAFDKVVDIDHCWLQPDPSNKIRNAARAIARAQGLAFWDAKENTGEIRNMVVRITSLGEILIVVAFGTDKQDKISAFLEALRVEIPEITSLYYCYNPKVNDFLLDLPHQLYAGRSYVEERLDHVRFRVGPKSFFQTNTDQAEILYRVAAEFADLQGHENVYDLYTGIGSIALYLAKDCRQVVGIEEVAAAIDDARVNAGLNGIDNSVFYAGDVKSVLTPGFIERHGRPDLLITDPPRAGMHPKVIAWLRELAPPRVVYVSCNPATQARDLAALNDRYAVTKMQPVDMFPHTHHIENVALLEIKV